MKKKLVEDSKVEMTEMVLPQHTNQVGTLFGGVLLSWIDIAASLCAMRHANKPVVTASIDSVYFIAPIHLGWVVSITASINYSSRTSCEVGVKVMAENPKLQKKFHATSAYLTMVSVDKNGKPQEIPQIELITEAQKKRFEEAAKRREASRLTWSHLKKNK